METGTICSVCSNDYGSFNLFDSLGEEVPGGSRTSRRQLLVDELIRARADAGVLSHSADHYMQSRAAPLPHEQPQALTPAVVHKIKYGSNRDVQQQQQQQSTSSNTGAAAEEAVGRADAAQPASMDYSASGAVTYFPSYTQLHQGQVQQDEHQDTPSCGLQGEGIFLLDGQESHESSIISGQPPRGRPKDSAMSCDMAGAVKAAEMAVISYPMSVRTFVIMEFCDKGSLQDAIDRGWLRHECSQLSPMDFSQALTLAMDIAHAMAYLHDRGIVHADLSAFNILLCSVPQTVSAMARAQQPAPVGNTRPSTSSALPAGQVTAQAADVQLEVVEDTEEGSKCSSRTTSHVRSSTQGHSGGQGAASASSLPSGRSSTSPSSVEQAGAVSVVVPGRLAIKAHADKAKRQFIAKVRLVLGSALSLPHVTFPWGGGLHVDNCICAAPDLHESCAACHAPGPVALFCCFC